MNRSPFRLLALLLTLLLLFTGASAAEPDYSIGDIGDALREVSEELTASQAAALEAEEEYFRLEAEFARVENTASDAELIRLQDEMFEALLANDEAVESAKALEEELLSLQEIHLGMLTEDMPRQTIETKGYASKLTIDVIVQDGVIWDLAITVDGDEKDQLVGKYPFTVQFIGRELPLTTDQKEEDHIVLLSEAKKTSQAVVDALNSLAKENGSKTTKIPKNPTAPLIEPQDIADYIFEYGELPPNFITKKEAQALGWDSSWNYVSDVAPGKSIGGDRFGNYEGLLPSKKGRQWYEADCYYTTGKRNAYRILYSNDGLVYYTDDHYETFTQMFPSGK